MTEARASLEEVYQRWKDANPDARIPSSATAVYRACRTPSCPVLIEAEQEREYCFGCGGKPSARGPLPRITLTDRRRDARRGIA